MGARWRCVGGLAAALTALAAVSPAAAAPIWRQVATAGIPGGQSAYWESMAATGADDVWAAAYRVAPLPGVTE